MHLPDLGGLSWHFPQVMLAELQDAHTLHLHRSLTSDLSESTLVGNANQAMLNCQHAQLANLVTFQVWNRPVARRAISDVSLRRLLGVTNDTMLRVEHATCNRLASTAWHLKLKQAVAGLPGRDQLYMYACNICVCVPIIASCSYVATNAQAMFTHLYMFHSMHKSKQVACIRFAVPTVARVYRSSDASDCSAECSSARVLRTIASHYIMDQYIVVDLHDTSKV